ncbi:MAG TPA: hypothetical protein VG890_18235 [Puia sp.]|nr:hypothetical protein [Puia sp.]
MAKTGAIPLKGKISNLIFYEFWGIPCVRTTPSKVRQTKSTKANAKLFGVAVSMSAALREGLVSFLPEDKGRKIMYRLNNALLQWLKYYEPDAKGLSVDLREINELQFNEACSLSLRLGARVKADWSNPDRVIIQIPALIPTEAIAAPAHTGSVIWHIAVTGCTQGNNARLTKRAAADFELPYTSDKLPTRQIELPFKLNPGELAIAAISLQYRIAKGSGSSIVSNPKWLPSGIVASAYCR